MTFNDLPEDLQSHPLSDGPIRGDVIDLILGIEDRRAGALAIMVCDDLDRGVQPLVLSDLPHDQGTDPLREVLELLLPTVGKEHGAVLIARGRRRGTLPTDDDRAWHQTAIDACSQHSVRLLGFYLATPDGISELPSQALPA